MSCATPDGPALAVTGLVAGYHSADHILNGAELEVWPGQMVAIVGPNGAGKSTLLKTIAGLLRAKAGEILLAGRPVHAMPARLRASAGLGFVPQEANVFPGMSVRENLEMGGVLDPRGASKRMQALFDRFPMLAEKRSHAARTLSGGQRQVLAMAMALMLEPRVLLLDEPSAGLSPRASDQLFDDIVSLHREGMTIVMVEQNAHEALAIADRGIVLVDGRVARAGPAAALAADPDVRRLFLGG